MNNNNMNNNNMNNNNNNNNNKSNTSSITDPILTKLLMEGFWDKTTTKTTATTNISKLLLTQFRLNLK